MILIKLIFANVTWWDIDWHPRLEDRKIDTAMRSIPFNFLIPYNELQEKTRWNIFKRVYKALEELEKGKPCKKTLFTSQKAEMKFLKLSPKPLSGITKRQKLKSESLKKLTKSD